MLKRLPTSFERTKSARKMSMLVESDEDIGIILSHELEVWRRESFEFIVCDPCCRYFQSRTKSLAR